MRADKKKAHMEQRFQLEEQLRKETGEQRQREKAMKQVKKIGKPLMKRDYAPPVEKVKVKVVKRGPQEEAYFNYLGLELHEK